MYFAQPRSFGPMEADRGSSKSGLGFRVALVAGDERLGLESGISERVPVRRLSRKAYGAAPLQSKPVPGTVVAQVSRTAILGELQGAGTAFGDRRWRLNRVAILEVHSGSSVASRQLSLSTSRGSDRPLGTLSLRLLATDLLCPPLGPKSVAQSSAQSCSELV